MKARFEIPQTTLDKQAAASDPASSVWVSANAGSGKTHVLAQRVIRLMLGGADPSKILCLTYTRAAAANMSNRVFRDLSVWTALPDAELAEAIFRIEGKRPDADKLRLARRLFTRALETPGGLKIQTIHAFCEALLHQFPLEANIAAHFQLLDAQMEAALFDEARRDMIGGAEGDPALAEAFATVLEHGGEQGLDRLLSEIVAKRVRLRAFIDGLSRAGLAPLYREFGLEREETEADIAAAAWPLPGLSPAEFSAFCDAARTAGASSILNNVLPDAVAGYQASDPVRRIELACAGLLTGKGEPYGERTFTKALVAMLPDIVERYGQAASALIAVRDRLALRRMVQATEAMLVIADFMIGRYDRLKTERGFLDFGDLITRTARLLARQDVGPWVQYKLDRGINHILLDEAQDTSPDQWAVVEQLANEFFVGASARDRVKRTIFAVGDEKQSIYSFQGADPTSFAESGRYFRKTVTEAERIFEDVQLTLSFRSTQDVLSAVDLVFDAPEARRGLSELKTAHSAVRHGAPGYVEIWPSIAAQSLPAEEDWRNSIDHLKAPALELAEQVARTIKGWIDGGAVLEGRGKRIAAGDVLVLVRKRDRFVGALSRALKDRNIPVAGADRLRLGAHIAVQDLLALGRFLQLPQDDLSLACVLKSPIFGLTEDQLYAVAAPRGGTTPFWAELRRRAGQDTTLADVVEKLERWRHEAAFRAPFEFYSGVLQRDGMRARMIARLGAEAGDMLDEFQSFCLAYEAPGLPGLSALVAALEAGGPEIRREMDQTRGEVRIMTVHASKGLEAPIVFLVDPGSAPASHTHLPKLIPFEGRQALRGVNGFLWNAGAASANQVASGISGRIMELADDEYRRLLYVGMTRAEDRLIICGYHGRTRQKDNCWHALATRALAPHCATAPHPVTGDEVLRYRSTAFNGTAAPAAEAETKSAPALMSETPPLGRTPSPPALPRPLTPSGAAAMIAPASDETPAAGSPVLNADEPTSFAVRRGLAMHKLLQVLPDIAPAERAAAAQSYLGQTAPDWTPAQRDAAWNRAAAILDNPAWAPLFAAGSRAEVSIAGTIRLHGRDRVVSGQIDRLAVTDEAVLIVDYKTNRLAPVSAAEAPDAYVLQLALYAELLKPLYPGKPVRAALLYTEAPRLIELPDAALAEALARLTGA